MKKIIHRIMFILLILVIVSNIIFVFREYGIKMFIPILLLLLLFTFIYRRREDVSTKLIACLSISLFLLALVYRIYLIISLRITPLSDFELYYNTALEIINGSLSRASYLAYNNYVYIFSLVLSSFLCVFGKTIISAIVFNVVCQVLTVVFLFLISKKYKNKYLLLLPVVWFSFPNVIFTTFLISTENLFILLFVIALYFFLTFKDNVDISFKNIIKYLIWGIFIGLINFIRPLMPIFLGAYVIYFIISNSFSKKYLIPVIVVISFLLSNLTIGWYTEQKIRIPKKSGALEWGLYYGSNYNTNGYWSENDAIEVGKTLEEEDGSHKLLTKTFSRYNELGVLRTAKLYVKKYYGFFSNPNANYDFVLSQISDDDVVLLQTHATILIPIGIVTSIIITFLVIKKIRIQLENNSNSLLLLELFGALYIILNLFSVLNPRYNYPVWIVLITMLMICDLKPSKKYKKQK